MEEEAVSSTLYLPVLAIFIMISVDSNIITANQGTILEPPHQTNTGAKVLLGGVENADGDPVLVLPNVNLFLFSSKVNLVDMSGFLRCLGWMGRRSI